MTQFNISLANYSDAEFSVGGTIQYSSTGSSVQFMSDQLVVVDAQSFGVDLTQSSVGLATNGESDPVSTTTNLLTGQMNFTFNINAAFINKIGSELYTLQLQIVDAPNSQWKTQRGRSNQDCG